jgi:serine/threonine protein kinase
LAIFPYFVPQQLSKPSETLTETQLKQFFFTERNYSIHATIEAPSNNSSNPSTTIAASHKHAIKLLSIVNGTIDGSLDDSTGAIQLIQCALEFAGQLQLQQQAIPVRSTSSAQQPLSIRDLGQLVESTDVSNCIFTATGLVQHSDSALGWIRSFFQTDNAPVRTQACLRDLYEAFENYQSGTRPDPMSVLDQARAGNLFSLSDFVLCKQIGAGSYGVLYAAHLNPERFPSLSEETCKSILVGIKFELFSSGRDFVLKFCRPFQILSTESPYLLDNLAFFSFVVVEGDGSETLNPIGHLCTATVMPLGKGSLEDRRIQLHGARPSRLITDDDLVFYQRTLLDMLKGLEALHGVDGTGNIHRDLKSANVVLMPTDDGKERAVICDFGTIRSSLGEKDTTPSDEGSPAFQSPEVKNNNKSYDHRTDIWSLGVMLFEFITGKIPDDADLAKHSSKEDRRRFIGNRFVHKFYSDRDKDNTCKRYVDFCAAMMQDNPNDRENVLGLQLMAGDLNNAFSPSMN